MQFTAIANYVNQPVFLGGCKSDESTQVNELSYLFLDVYDKMKIYSPKIQIKVADSTPKEFLLKALDMVRRGNNSIVFVNDAVISIYVQGFFLTGGKFFYNVMLVSAVQSCKSAIIIHISPPS